MKKDIRKNAVLLIAADEYCKSIMFHRNGGTRIYPGGKTIVPQNDLEESTCIDQLQVRPKQYS